MTDELLVEVVVVLVVVVVIVVVVVVVAVVINLTLKTNILSMQLSECGFCCEQVGVVTVLLPLGIVYLAVPSNSCQ